VCPKLGCLLFVRAHKESRVRAYAIGVGGCQPKTKEEEEDGVYISAFSAPPLLGGVKGRGLSCLFVAL
jgi:hypothetical protein